MQKQSYTHDVIERDFHGQVFYYQRALTAAKRIRSLMPLTGNIFSIGTGMLLSCLLVILFLFV
jgi:hypothetical protein